MICPYCKEDIRDGAIKCRYCGSLINEGVTPELDQTLPALNIEAQERYEIKEELGRGGMGRVYKAYDKHLKRYVALKILSEEISNNPVAIKRFEQEAILAAGLSHPNIIVIHDIKKEQGKSYISMNYIEGKTLKEILDERKNANTLPFPLEEVIAIMRQVCSALSEAHQHKLIHRDIKPSNIMIDKKDRVVVTDFGIAKAVTATTGFTATGTTLGTPQYISPEQAEGKSLDKRSDIYSLGIVLYEMLTGKVPFQAETPVATAIKHIKELPRHPREFNPGLPEEIERIILKAIAKNPEDRYEDADHLAHDLAYYQESIEKKRRQEEKQKEEEQKRQAEELLRLERERVEEEKKRIERETEARRLAEEKRKEEEEQRRKEELLRIEQEKKRLAEERKKKEEEERIRKQEEETRRRIEEQRRKKEEEERHALLKEREDLKARIEKEKLGRAPTKGKRQFLSGVILAVIILSGAGVFLLKTFPLSLPSPPLLKTIPEPPVSPEPKTLPEAAPQTKPAETLFEVSSISKTPSIPVAPAVPSPKTEVLPKAETQGVVRETKETPREIAEATLKAATPEPELPPAAPLPSPSSTPVQPPPPVTAEDYLKEGKELAELGKHEEAKAAFKKSLELEPGLVDAYYALAKIYYDQGRYEEALGILSTLIGKKPGEANAYCEMGINYHRLKRYKEAVTALQKAIQLKPDCAEAYFTLGATYYKLGRQGEAINSLNKSIALDAGDYHAFLQLGSIYSKSGSYSKAIPLLKKAIELKPDYTDAYYALGMAYIKGVRTAEATEVLKKLFQLDPFYIPPQGGMDPLFFLPVEEQLKIKELRKAAKPKDK